MKSTLEISQAPIIIKRYQIIVCTSCSQIPNYILKMHLAQKLESHSKNPLLPHVLLAIKFYSINLPSGYPEDNTPSFLELKSNINVSIIDLQFV